VLSDEKKGLVGWFWMGGEEGADGGMTSLGDRLDSGAILCGRDDSKKMPARD